jgi:hypothetical protein
MFWYARTTESENCCHEAKNIISVVVDDAHGFGTLENRSWAGGETRLSR